MLRALPQGNRQMTRADRRRQTDAPKAGTSAVHQGRRDGETAHSFATVAIQRLQAAAGNRATLRILEALPESPPLAIDAGAAVPRVRSAQAVQRMVKDESAPGAGNAPSTAAAATGAPSAAGPLTASAAAAGAASSTNTGAAAGGAYTLGAFGRRTAAATAGTSSAVGPMTASSEAAAAAASPGGVGANTAAAILSASTSASAAAAAPTSDSEPEALTYDGMQVQARNPSLSIAEANQLGRRAVRAANEADTLPLTAAIGIEPFGTDVVRFIFRVQGTRVGVNVHYPGDAPPFEGSTYVEGVKGWVRPTLPRFAREAAEGPKPTPQGESWK